MWHYLALFTLALCDSAPSDNNQHNIASTGLLPVWTYADDSGCLETRVNYLALWITMWGTAIDSGHPSSTIKQGQDCAEQGYTKQTDIFKDLPSIIRAVYAGVTSWSKPSGAIIPIEESMQDNQMVVNTDLLPVWTYADDSGCLETHVNYLALWITMKGTGIDSGHASSTIKHGKTCAEQGYTKPTDIFKDLPAIIRAGYAGVTTWSKPSGVVLVAKALNPESQVASTGLLPVWTYADDSGCLETHVNYLALWITMKGTAIDSGHPSSTIKHGQTCAEQGYTKQTDIFKDLPSIIRAAYAGVTTWSKPAGVVLAVGASNPESTVAGTGPESQVASTGLLPVWTYADDSGCLETHVNYLALWITMKGTGIDTGHASSTIKHGKTCAEQGYTNQTDTFKDLPSVIRAVYAGVTTWARANKAPLKSTSSVIV